jgi:hypothetical protein
MIDPIYAPNITLPYDIAALCNTEVDVRLAKLYVVCPFFHPEDTAHDYARGDGTPCFTAEQADAIDADIALQYEQPGDPCTFGLRCMARLGLISHEEAECTASERDKL